MKIVYKDLDIYEQFDAAIKQAKQDGKRIKQFVISEDEFEEFIRLGNDPDHLFAGYTTKLNATTYSKEYSYKNIQVVTATHKEYV